MKKRTNTVQDGRQFSYEQDYTYRAVALVGGWVCGYVAIDTVSGCGTIWLLLPVLWAWSIIASISSSYFADNNPAFVIAAGAVFHALLFFVTVWLVMRVGTRYGLELTNRRWQFLIVMFPLFFVLIRYTVPASDCP